MKDGFSIVESEARASFYGVDSLSNTFENLQGLDFLMHVKNSVFSSIDLRDKGREKKSAILQSGFLENFSDPREAMAIIVILVTALSKIFSFVISAVVIAMVILRIAYSLVDIIVSRVTTEVETRNSTFYQVSLVGVSARSYIIPLVVCLTCVILPLGLLLNWAIIIPLLKISFQMEVLPNFHFISMILFVLCCGYVLFLIGLEAFDRAADAI